MPTYEYKCEACGHKFEKFQSMSSAPVRKCPSCGKSLQAPDSAAGKKAQCPSCQTISGAPRTVSIPAFA